MAVTKIWSLYGSLAASVDYAKNKEKTGIKNNEPSVEIKDLEQAINYISQEHKTEEKLYVSGINCSANNATAEMIDIKKLYGKTDGCVGYHTIQSFAPGEIDPEQAHAIGLEYANQIWGKEGYQCLVCTHLDRNHIHNHIVINSVNMLTGEKDPVRYHRTLSKVSDGIIAQYGLSVIKNPGQSPSKMPRLSKRNRETKLYIDSILAQSEDLKDFIRLASLDGYAIKCETNRQYWTIQHESWNRPLRMIRLGEDYSNANILRRAEEDISYISTDELSIKEQYQLGEQYGRIQNWKDTAQYKYYMMLFKMGIDLRKYRSNKIKPSPQELAEFERLTKRISYMNENDIRTDFDASQRLIIVRHKIDFLKEQQKDARTEVKQKRNHNLSFAEEQQVLDEINQELEDYNSELKILKEIRNRDDNLERSEIEKENGINNKPI